MSEARPAVKRARLDPRVIAEWSEVCARDAVLRRRLRVVAQVSAPASIGVLLLTSALHWQVGATAVLAVIALGFTSAFVARYWNLGLVGTPPCPACGVPIVMYGGRYRSAIAYPESIEWCPHCFVWLKHPSDPHRPLT